MALVPAPVKKIITFHLVTAPILTPDGTEVIALERKAETILLRRK
jgi:hypothetical protein